MVLDKKEFLILAYLRKNARKNLTKISRETGIPVSTIFDKIKRYEGKLIRKHTCLLNFNELGFDVRVNMIIRVNREDREKVKEFLIKNEKVNSVYRINNNYDFLIEGIFRHMKELNEFCEQLEHFKIKTKEEYYILEDLKREAFLADPEFLKIMPMGA